jgi:Zn-dependent protease with chaperone function
METDRVILEGISSRAWEHPADRAALEAMRKLPGFELALRKIFGAIGDRSLRLATLASAVRVDERQFADVHALYLQACEVLDVQDRPELFVAQTPLVNAGAVGVDKPFIVLNSGTLALLKPDELQFVLAHELGHVLSGHVPYKTMLSLLLRLSILILSIPLGGAAIMALTTALLEWDRKSELSADRAAMLGTQDPELARRVNMKLAGGGRTEDMSVDAFLEQAREYEEGGSVLDGVIKLLNLVGRTHPFPVLRLAELQRWEDSGDYGRILEGDYERRGDEEGTSVLSDLKSSTESYADDFSTSKDPLARWLQDRGKDVKSASEKAASFFRRRDDDEPEPSDDAPIDD